MKERHVKMLSTLLILLGSVLMLLAIMIAILFMIAGVLRRRPENIKALTAFGIIGLLMIALGVLPWEIAEVVGIVALTLGGFAFFFFILLPGYKKEKWRKEVLKMRECVRREHVKPVLQYLTRIGAIVGITLLIDVIGLWAFLFSQRLWSFLGFTELLTVLLLLEGSLIGAGGAFMFLGYSEAGIARQGAINPAIAADHRQRWRERRLSQQKWGVGMLIAGVLLISLGLLVNFLTSL